MRAHVVTNLVLVMINDGDGSQCGMTYAQRCDAAEAGHGLALFREAARRANSWSVTREMPSATRQELLYVANDVLSYYRRHMQERGL